MPQRPTVVHCENMMQSARVEQLADSQPLASSSLAYSPTGCKVSIIDDSSITCRVAQIFLTQAGYRVVPTEDGFDALAKVSDLKPGLVFCDILMPNLDGHRTYSPTKKGPKLHATPVIMLSSRDGIFDHAQGKSIGTMDHSAKPFSKETLLETVQTHLPVTQATVQ